MLMNVLAAVLTLLYPLAIWLGHGQVEPRWLAGLLLLAALTRLPALALSNAARWSMAGALALVAYAIWSNGMLPLKLYPVLVNVVMLAGFGYSLTTPMSAIERMARLRGEDFAPPAQAYMRRVTQVWCGFFVLNGSVALALALWASAGLWSLYTGVISYGLIGVLFAVEYMVRLRFKRLQHG
jgi:uncharacterized membrane protein